MGLEAPLACCGGGLAGIGQLIIHFFILLHEKFLQSDWLRAVIFEIPTCENYKPFADSSINKK